jgi:protein subunit release factor B
MAALGVREEDFQERFVRSGGHGGQNVNKVSTCVMLVHLPSGLSVKCQGSRNQAVNRSLARHLLLNKIEAQRKSLTAARRAQREKIRRRNRPRPRGLKEKILKGKKRRSEIKAHRRKVQGD